MSASPLRFGAFLAPFHPVKEHPGLALERDFQLIEHLDRLGYDEAWIGEHHSGGYETIASPELFVAAAAERTRRIRLGTGVVSLPYHQPLMVADRAVQLDWQTRGRFMLGVGPGALPSDAMMLGIDPLRQREMMDESLEALVPLLRGEVVSRRTDWYTLSEARLQLAPYSRPQMDIAVAAMTSPAGPRVAGKHGLGLLSLGATTDAGYMALGQAWAIVEEEARRHGQVVDRRNWRLVGPMYIAETREQALADVRFGLSDWAYYYTKVIALPFKLPDTFEGQVQALTETGFAVIGTPDDAIAQIERLQEQAGGAGAFLFMAHNWADFPQTLRSYELFARYVIPRFNGLNAGRQASMDWVAANRDTFMGAGRAAKEKASRDYAAEKSRGTA
ncbi:MAG TPA: LLM class flavin-dependent oxidoreductase [bacterium]|nr:LLM class flavin-dependent oxidoreductase [bacterium]